VLGTLILAFGWYGFNVGTAATVFAVEDGALTLGAFSYVGRVAMTTTIAMACGAIGASAVSLLKTGKVDTLYVANGLLAGLVGITAIPDTTTWWGAFVVGGIAGAQLPIVFGFVEKRLKIDDVCAVFPVHGSAGVIGTLLFPFVATSSALEGTTMISAFIDPGRLRRHRRRLDDRRDRRGVRHPSRPWDRRASRRNTSATASTSANTASTPTPSSGRTTASRRTAVW